MIEKMLEQHNDTERIGLITVSKDKTNELG
jgi:hypothetical protein